MKSTGIVRKLDALGRLCLPKEVRRVLHMDENSPVEFFLDGDQVVIRKYDVRGDMEALLNNLENAVRDADGLPEKTAALLEKVAEMKKIASECG